MEKVDRELIQIKFEKVIQSKAYTCVVLSTEQKRFAIYSDSPSGKAMQLPLMSAKKMRPGSHDLINMIFRGLDVTIRQIVIQDVVDTIYHARLFLEQKMGDILHILEIDARPSDCIVLALMNGTPVFCTPQVLEKVVPFVEED